jgi:twitching motility protein PilJ
MADKAKEARYVPILALILLLVLGGASWLLYNMSITPATAPPGLDSYLYTQSASVQARKALDGDERAWGALELTADRLAEIRTDRMSSESREQLGEAREHVSQILGQRGEASALQQSVERLGELIPGFADGVSNLQDELSGKNLTVVVAQLARLRQLSDTVLTLAKQLPSGDAAADRKLVQTEEQLQQVVRALQAGDPQLGMVALIEEGTEQAVASLARRAAQIGAAVRESRKLAQQLASARNAAEGLEKLVLAGAKGAEQLVSPEPRDIDSELQRVLALLGGCAFLIFVIVMIWFRTSDSRTENARLVQQTESDQQAILQLLDELDSLADGDLTVQASVNESITGAIADSVNYAVEALRDLVTTINDGAILLEDATRQTEDSAIDLSAASEVQARKVKEAFAAVRQMVASIDEVSGNAERSSDVARHSVDIAHKGGEAVRRTIEGMNTIRETIQDTSKRIKRLGESSQEIGDIVELINDIADQTNILALNASIQASMAGEAGRGFAVVADEVQRLAERSASATKQIEVLVSTIQSDTNEAVVSMERSTTDVVGGALLAENAGAALEEIEQVSNQIAMLVQNISGSAKDQANDAKVVLQSVEKLQEISSKTGASASNTAKYISKLSELASHLREAASGFTLPQSKADEESPQPQEPAEDEQVSGPAGGDADMVAKESTA